MIDALDGDRQGSMLGQNNETLLLQVPLVELEILMRALQHVLKIKSDYASVLGILSSPLIQELENFRVVVGITER